MGDAIKEQIALSVDVGSVKGNSLTTLIGQLDKLEARWKQVEATLNGTSLGNGQARSVKQFVNEIQQLQTKLGAGLKLGDLAKNLNVPLEAAESRLARMSKSIDGFNKKSQEFRSAPAAGRFMAGVEKELKQRRLQLSELLKPTVSSISGSAGVEGHLALAIPAAQVQASVAGQITLVIPAGQVQGAVQGGVSGWAGGGSPPTGGGGSGASAPAGGGGGGKKKKKSGKQPLSIGGSASEIERVRTETADYVRESIKEIGAVGDIITTTHDSVEGVIKTSTKKFSGDSPKAMYAQMRRILDEQFRQAKALLDPKDTGYGLAKILDKQASQLRGLTQGAFMAKLGAPQQAQVKNLLEEKAKTLEAKASQSRKEAQIELQNQAQRSYEERQKRRRQAQQQANRNYQQQIKAQNESLNAAMGKGQLRAGLAEIKVGTAPAGVTASQLHTAYAQDLRAALQSAPKASNKLRKQAESAAREAEAKAHELRNSPPPIPKPPKTPKPQRNSIEKGLAHFTPMGFAGNLLNVSGWAAAVGVLYKSLEAAQYSLKRFLDIGRETAQLSVVFRGVGGNAQQLTDDLLRLASANGRDTEEAMKSGQEWARLGLSRAEVNEAVKVSMMAANVADMNAGETTKQLSSLMHIYGFEVGDLNGMLGMLVRTSQRYNVTLEDLFTGLDRAAGIAKESGMSFAELQGVIGATVGKTGQSGAMIGNTIKSVVSQFSNPSIQKYLRSLGVEALTPGLDQKSGSEILRQIFIRYQSLGDRQRQDLTRVLVGRLRSSQFVGMMDGYLESQKLAIDGQLHLNAAQEANARILGTIKAQLAGIRSEWDRLIVKQMNAAGISGGRSVGQQLETAVQFGSNVIKGAPGLFDQLPNWLKIGPQYLRHPLLTIAHPYIDTLMRGANHAMEAPLDRQFNQAQAEMQKHRSAASAYAMQNRLFRTVGDVLPYTNRPEALENLMQIASSEMDKNTAAAFDKMVKGGNIPGAQAILNAQADQAKKKSGAEASADIASRNRFYAIDKSEAARLDDEIQKLQEQGGAQDELNKKMETRMKLDKQMADMRQENADDIKYLEDEAGQTQEVIELKQQYINLLKEQQMVMQAIDQLSTQGTPDLMGARLDAQAQGLEQQVSSMEEQEVRLRKRGEEGKAAADQLKNQLAEARAQLAAIQSPQMQAAAQMYDERAVAGRRAQLEGQSHAVGRTESEKLLREQAYLQEQLDNARQKAGTTGLTENEAVRAKQFEVQLWETQVRLQERILELAREEKQVRMDASREYQKNFLLAGPGEQLQRLYVGQLLSRKGGIGFGEFNALSPEAKRLYWEGSGGDRGALLREEMRLVGQPNPIMQRGNAAAAFREYHAALADWQQHDNINYTGRAGSSPLTVEGARRQQRLMEAMRQYQGALHGGSAMTVEEHQRGMHGASARMGQWNAVLGRFTQNRMAGLPEMPLPSEAKGQMAMNANTLAVNSNTAATRQLTAAINNAASRGSTHTGSTPAAPPPRFGISPGFAPGSHSPGAVSHAD